MEPSALTTLFSNISGAVSSAEFLVGLGAVCAVIAVIKFSNRASGTLLNKIGRG
ncbi:hypothetical protein [Sphingomonas sp. DT-204]|uniref:hypothetical protein n=1 Tax=Sphingomonas sp. DT-204 TaxID=3396166 RepID=UPI003F1DD752